MSSCRSSSKTLLAISEVPRRGNLSFFGPSQTPKGAPLPSQPGAVSGSGGLKFVQSTGGGDRPRDVVRFIDGFWVKVDHTQGKLDSSGISEFDHESEFGGGYTGSIYLYALDVGEQVADLHSARVAP